MVKIIKLIYTEERIGDGEKNDPVRLCPQLWTEDGSLVATTDYHTGKGYFYANELRP